MNENQANELRDKILNDIKPLVVNEIEDTTDRFNAIVKIIRFGNADYNLYRKAYEAASKIDDDAEKKDSLMILLDLIDDQSSDKETENDLMADHKEDSDVSTR
jgi:hypothetical protein